MATPTATITNAAVLPAYLALNQLSQQKLPVAAAFRVRQMHRAITTALEDLESVRNGLIERYALRDEAGAVMNGEPDPQGNPTILLSQEGAEQIPTAMAELLAQPVECPTLSVASLGEALSIEPGVLMSLGDLLVD
jgi:hypothetical protein